MHYQNPYDSANIPKITCYHLPRWRPDEFIKININGMDIT